MSTIPARLSKGFFSQIVGALVREHDLSTGDSVLVVCGGPYDAATLREAGFTSVTISNVDIRYDDACRPFEWSRQDAESLTFEDKSFDWTMVHAGLHHCASPHRALLEMCRVARKGVLVLEARDSILVRFAARFGFTHEYEIDAVVDNGFTMGGVRNSAIPNYVYRWTEREVRKTIESAYPHRENVIRYFYGIRLPIERLLGGSARKRALGIVLAALAVATQSLFRRQCNQFGFAIFHSDKYKPWINVEGTGLKRRYLHGGNHRAYVVRKARHPVAMRAVR